MTSEETSMNASAPTKKATTPTPACSEPALIQLAPADAASAACTMQTSTLTELNPPSHIELADSIVTHGLLPYLHLHSRSVFEYETRCQFFMIHYRPQLISLIESEMRAAPSHSYKNLDLIVSKCTRLLE